MTFVLGLTGSIGMGKSATAAILRRFGAPVHDADACVHARYRGKAAPLIEAAFPGVVREGAVDRAALSAVVLGRPERIAALERIVHPLVRQARDGFLGRAKAAGAAVAVLDIPLLLETGGDADCDAVLVVTAPEAEQRRRVLARPGMTAQKFEAIRSRQMPDGEKRRRAHFIVDTGRGFPAAQAQIAGILRALAGRPGHVLAGATER